MTFQENQKFLGHNLKFPKQVLHTREYYPFKYYMNIHDGKFMHQWLFYLENQNQNDENWALDYAFTDFIQRRDLGGEYYLIPRNRYYKHIENSYERTRKAKSDKRWGDQRDYLDVFFKTSL